MTNSKQYKYVR